MVKRVVKEDKDLNKIEIETVKNVKTNKNDDNDVYEVVKEDTEEHANNLMNETDYNLLGARPKTGKINSSKVRKKTCH